MYLPAEIIDLIMFYVEIGTLQSSPKTSIARPFRIMNVQTRKNLAGLRLVNKSFCHSASIRLFRHIIALAGSLCHTAHLPPVGKLVSISSSQYAQYVRQVDLGYGSLPCSVEDIILYTEDLVGLLSSCLRQFPNLKALDFSGPPLTSLPHDKMKASIDPILMALCYVPLPNLTELEIQLPMTNDFAPLFAEKISILRIPIEQTLNRLHHLGLHVYAQTNQQSCATHLLRIVELSTSLTSLSLSSTNFLSIDSLRLSSKVCLRALSLHKVKISSRNLVNIIEQSIESMAYIELRHLQIEPGSPREILSAVDSLLCLCDLDICDGGAPTRTERFHLAQSLFFTAEHVQEPGLFSLVYDASQNPKQKAKSKRTMARDFSH